MIEESTMNRIIDGSYDASDEFINICQKEATVRIENLSFWELAASVRPMVILGAWDLISSPKRERFGQFSAGGNDRRDNCLQAFGVVEKILEIEPALAFRRTSVADCEQAAKAAIGLAIFRIGNNVRRIVPENEARADCEFEAGFLRRDMRPHDAGE